MKIIPAVDLMDGKVVRLRQGNVQTRMLYDRNPLDLISEWKRAGAETIQIIDIDRAIGRGENAEVIQDVISHFNGSVHVGGGLRSLDVIGEVLCNSNAKAIIGTSALTGKGFLSRVISTYGSNRIIVAVDHRNGKVLSHGWLKNSGLRIEEAISNSQSNGATTFLLTSVQADGMMSGPDLETIDRITSNATCRIIVAGGIREINDILALTSRNVQGVVIGRAVLEGSLDLFEAIRVARRRN